MTCQGPDPFRLEAEELRVLKRALAYLVVTDGARDGEIARRLLARAEAVSFAREVIAEELGPPTKRPLLVVLQGGMVDPAGPLSSA